jgi:hypothetical protein
MGSAEDDSLRAWRSTLGRRVAELQCRAYGRVVAELAPWHAHSPGVTCMDGDRHRPADPDTPGPGLRCGGPHSPRGQSPATDAGPE